MALRMDKHIMVFGKEVVLENTYVRIDTFVGNKEKISINVNMYTEDMSQVIENIPYEFTADYTPDETGLSKNLLEQGYNYLKTLEQYANATDC